MSQRLPHHSERQRIAFFHPYPHRMGGSQQVALLLARHLASTGYEPVIICPEDGSFTTAAREAGIEVLLCMPGASWREYGHGAEGIQRWLSLAHARDLVSYWLKLRRVLLEQRIAILHCHNVRAAIMAAQAGWLARVPTLWHIHGAPPEGFAGWLGTLLGLAAQSAVFVSEGMIEYWMGRRFLLGSKRIIHNGIDEFAPVEACARDRRRPLIIAVGSLSTVKGQDLLLAALPRVLQAIPAAQCWIVGKDWAAGAFETQLQQMVQSLGLSDCVEFLGERRDVSALFAASDCVVIPSRSEAFGMVAIEAMVQCKPVVAASTGGLRDIVIDGETGFLVRAEQADALAGAVIDVLRDPDRAHRMGAAGRRRVMEKFTAVGMARRFAAQYDDMLRAARMPGLFQELPKRLWYGALMRKRWTIGVSRWGKDLDQRRIENVRLLPPLKGADFLADPFLIPGMSGRVMLCEWLRADRGRGVIARLELNSDDSIADLSPLIDRADCHLSYPYAFEHEGRLYCCPEAAQSRQITLYELSPDARQVKSETVLVRDFAAKDPSLFRFEGRWWLFCTSAAPGESLSHLCAFHALQLHGPWTAHRLNPILIDAARARPAGTVFERNGETFRPGQDCAQTYGAAVRILRILRLTPDEYTEEPAWTIYPPRSARGADGIHTLSVDGDVVAIDACEHVYDSLAWVGRVRERLRV